MVISKVKMDSFGVTANAAFLRGQQAGSAESIAKRIATPIDMSTQVVELPISSAVPQLREWVGARQTKALAHTKITLSSRPFEGTVSISMDDIDSDNLGLFPASLEDLAKQAEIWPDVQLAKFIEANGLAYDGVAYFATNHVVGGANVSNLTAGAGDAWYLLDCSKAAKPFIFGTHRAPELQMLDERSEHAFQTREIVHGVFARGAAAFGLWQFAHKSKATLDAAGLDAAYTTMLSRRNEEGNSLRVRPTHLVVPPSLKSAADRLINAQTNANGATNTYHKAVEVVVCYDLTGA